MSTIDVTRRTVLLAALPFALQAETKTTTLAGVRFRTIRNGKSNRSYLLIHGNERTAREVLESHMRTAQGKAHMVTGFERMVRVRGLLLDPNRMFSRVGAERSFKRLNPGAGEAKIQGALRWLDGARPALINALLPPPGGLIIALHNNSEGYSLEDEVGLSESVHLPARGVPNDFVLTTSEADFEILSNSPFNVVLQSAVLPDDDGSLSRLAASRGVRYVNIEAYIGRRADQEAMLEWVEKNLP